MKKTKQKWQLCWAQKMNRREQVKEITKIKTIFKYQYTAEDKASSAVYFFMIK